MTRFVSATVQTIELSDAAHINAYGGDGVVRAWLRARRVAVSKIPKAAIVDTGKAALAALPLQEAVESLVAVATRKPRVAAAVARAILRGEVGSEALATDDKTRSTRHRVWFAQSLLREVFKDAVAADCRHVVSLTLKARVLPEGAIPSDRELGDLMRRYASRVLRDRDASPHPWIDAFGLDAIAKPTWNPWPIDAAWMTDRTTREGTLHVVTSPEWTSHLAVGDTFDAAP